MVVLAVLVARRPGLRGSPLRSQRELEARSPYVLHIDTYTYITGGAISVLM